MPTHIQEGTIIVSGNLSGSYPNPSVVGPINGNLQINGQLDTTGDLYASTNGSDTDSPRVFGYKELSSGEACRFQFGDEHNAFQNGYAKDTTIYSYWGLVLCGGMQNYNSGFLPPEFTKTTDTGVLIISTNDIGDDPGEGATNIVTCAIKAVASQINDLFQIRDSNNSVMARITASGVLHTEMMRQVSTWNAFGGFQDQAEELSLDADTWTHVTNAGNNLWNCLEADGLSIEGDELVVANAGDYFGNLSITITGDNSKDFKFRVYNVTQSGVMGYHIGASTTASNYTNISIPLYLECNAGDHLQVQAYCLAGDNPTLRSAIFYINYLHE